MARDLARDSDAEASGRPEADPDAERGESTLLGRRSYLRLGLAAAAVSSTTAVGTTAAQTELGGITFDRTVDITDYGGDPTGGSSVNGAISDAAAEGTLIEFPEGEYQLSGRIDVRHDRVGFVGRGDVRFVLPSGHGGRYLLAADVDEILFKGIDVDMRGDRTGHMQLRCPSSFHVEDVEYLGRGGLTGYAFLTAITGEGGTGTLRNVVIKKGGYMDRYDNGSGSAGDGRIGIWAGYNHRGTLRVENCDIREFGNNGMYTSRCPGNVQVVDSYFENNNVASIRISGEGSYAENCEVLVDHSRYEPEVTSEQGFNTRGIIVEQGKGMTTDEFPAKPAGAEIRNCKLTALNTYNDRNMQSVIEQGPQARTLTIRDTEVHTNVSDVPAVRRGFPGYIRWRTDQRTVPGPHWTKLENVTITGEAAGGSAVVLNDADGSEVRNCCITQTGRNREGIRFVDASNGLVEDCDVDVTAQAVVSENSSVETRNVGTDASCSGSDSGSGGSDGSDSGGSDSGDTTDHEVMIVADPGVDRFPYELVVDGTAEPITDGSYPADGSDSVVDNGDGTTTITGYVADNSGDRFGYTGTLVEATLDGPGSLSVDGEVVDPDAIGGSDSGSGGSDGSDSGGSDGSDSGGSDGSDGSDSGDTTDHEVRIVADLGADRFDFELLVDGTAEPITDGSYPADSNDSVVDNGDGTTTIAGQVVDGGGDRFGYTGTLVEATLDGPGTLSIDGDAVDPDTIDGSDGSDSGGSDGSDGSDSGGSDGSDSGDTTEDHEVMIVADPGVDRFTYEFLVDGTVEPVTSGSYPADGSDSVADNGDGTTTITGYVADNSGDRFRYTGTLVEATLDGPGSLYVDGEVVDPDAIGGDAGTDLPNLIVFDGSATDGTCEYAFDVTGEVVAAPDLGSLEDADTVAEGTVTGSVDDDVDGYRFSGDLSISDITGTSSITFEDNDG